MIILDPVLLVFVLMAIVFYVYISRIFCKEEPGKWSVKYGLSGQVPRIETGFESLQECIAFSAQWQKSIEDNAHSCQWIVWYASAVDPDGREHQLPLQQ